MKNILIAIDNDGTLIYDKKLHIGHTNDWKRKIKILLKVEAGINYLRKKLPKAKLYIISNQSGVAIKDFKLLTKKRSNKVCNYVNEKLKLDGFVSCGKVNEGYKKRRKQYKFNEKFVCDCACIKPNIGMINQILKELDWKKSSTLIFVVGDRYTDVKSGLNSNGFGVLIPSVNEAQEEAKLIHHILKKDKKKVYVAKNFLDAGKWIVSKIK